MSPSQDKGVLTRPRTKARAPYYRAGTCCIKYNQQVVTLVEVEAAVEHPAVVAADVAVDVAIAAEMLCWRQKQQSIHCQQTYQYFCSIARTGWFSEPRK